MKDNRKIGRRTSLPIIYVRGSHYDIGFDIGRTFASLIQTLVETHKGLNDEYLPLYETPEGKEVYDETLASVTSRFPQYVRELQGTADGAGVPFFKLFLVHMDDILPNVVKGTGSNETNGCSTVCSNYPDNEILAHNEDVFSEVMNNVYIVNAHITDSTPHEVFTSYCYAGFLPGFAMSYNRHGLVFSVNIISAKRLVSGKTPRSFLTRALLSADSLYKAEAILRDSGCGAGDAVSINMTLLKQEGDRLFHNIEVAPPPPGGTESLLSVLTLSPMEHAVHCNKFLRLNVDEVGGPIVSSSTARHEVAARLPPPDSVQRIINFLGDQSGAKFTVFRESGPDDYVKTVSVGFFDCINRTWTIYMDNPKTSDPIAVLPIDIN